MQYGAATNAEKENGTIVTEWDLDQVVTRSSTDERGVETVYQHDEYGNVISEKTGDLPAATRVFLKTGGAFTDKHVVNLVSSETDRNGNVTTYIYDDEGHLERMAYADGIEEVYSYYPNGTGMSLDDPVLHTCEHRHMFA